jgi:hypothetical protein
MGFFKITHLAQFFQHRNSPYTAALRSQPKLITWRANCQILADFDATICAVLCTNGTGLMRELFALQLISYSHNPIFLALHRPRRLPSSINPPVF